VKRSRDRADDTLAALDAINDEVTAAQDKDLREKVANLTLDLPGAGAAR